MKTDDILYLILLVSCIVIGYFIRKLQCKVQRQWISTLIGISLTWYLCSWSMMWPVLSVLINIVIINYSQFCHFLSFVTSFFLLLLCRSSTMIGFTQENGFVNSIQMLLTLKMVGVAYEVHQSRLSKNIINGMEPKRNLTHVAPSALDIFHYAFCYIGLVTGPYYKFKTYNDLYTADYSEHQSCTIMTLKRLAVVPLYVVLFLASDYYFPLTNLEDPEIYYKWSFWYKIFYMSPIFFNFRMRLYTGFILSECACMIQGLGAYPSSRKSKPGEGPTVIDDLNVKEEQEGAIDFNTVYNIDVMGSEFKPTVRDGMRSWNITVQYWLVVNVYKPLSGYPKAIRTVATMMTSAVWHGIHSGYYLSLLTIPFILIVEDMVWNVIREKLNAKIRSIFDIFWLCLKMQWYSYMSIAFLLLEIQPIMNFWHSIGYIGHAIIVLFFCICQSVSRSKTLKVA